MKTFTKLFALIFAVGLLTFACQPENVQPKSGSDSPAMAAVEDSTHPRPAPQCSPSVWYDVVSITPPSNSAGTLFYPAGNYSVAPNSASFANPWDYGTLEIANDPTSRWVILTLGAGWYTNLEALFIGDISTVPMNGSNIAVEQFPFSYTISPSRNFFQTQLPATGLPTCTDIVCFARIHRVNTFSQPTWLTQVWGAGQPFANGMAINDNCFVSCPEITTTDTCVYTTSTGTIGAASVTGGVAPFTYTWSNGATTATQNVGLGSYSLTVSDAMGNGGVYHFIVCNGGANCPCAPTEVTLTGGECKGCNSYNTVTFSGACGTCVNVSSCKDLSNVVLGFADCTTYKFDGLSAKTGTFCSPNNQGIVVVWVKSGCNQSGDGPGFGRRFNNPLCSSTCTSFTWN